MIVCAVFGKKIIHTQVGIHFLAIEMEWWNDRINLKRWQDFSTLSIVMTSEEFQWLERWNRPTGFRHIFRTF